MNHKTINCPYPLNYFRKFVTLKNVFSGFGKPATITMNLETGKFKIN